MKIKWPFQSGGTVPDMKYNDENYNMDEIGTQFGGFTGCIIWMPIMILIFWIPIILLSIWILYQ